MFSTWKAILPPSVNGTRSSGSSDFFAFALGDHDLVVADEDRLAAGVAVPHHDRMVAVDGEEEDAAGHMRRHAHHQGIGGVEHGGALRAARRRRCSVSPWPGPRRVDFAQAEVVAFADVGHDGDVAAVEGQALAEDAAAGGFQHGRVDAGFMSTAAALCGPLQSPRSIRRPSMKMPSVQVMPTRRPVPLRSGR